VGADYFERIGAISSADGDAPRGLVDRMSDLAHPGIDVERVHSAIIPFFVDTASLELLVVSHWRFPFSAAWRGFRGVMRRIGQFVLPLPLSERRIVTRVRSLDRERDGRADARAIIRTYQDSGDVMQVVAYATWERDGARYMSAAFPLPLGHVAGFLRLDEIATDENGRSAIALRSARRKTDDAGVWFVLGPLAFPSPFGEELALWAAQSSCAPAEIDSKRLEGATIVGRHEQSLFGVRFVTHHYWFRRVRELPE
jgi:hypothetical protein